MEILNLNPVSKLDDEDNGSINQCAKPKGSVKKACRLYVGKPGIKKRDKLKFDF